MHPAHEFRKFRRVVIHCNQCRIKPNPKSASPSRTIQLPHSNPNTVRILVITEQPKIVGRRRITNGNFLKGNYRKTHATAGRLIETLREEFNESITNRNGIYYWTHHTKCPSANRKQQARCMKNYLIKEISLFRHLRLIITFGSYAYTQLMKEYIGNGFNESRYRLTKDYFDNFHELLEQNIKKRRVQEE